MPIDGVPGYVARLQLVGPETTYGTKLASPTPSNRFEICLRDRAGANIRQVANKVVQQTAGGRNRPGRQVVGRKSVPFRINTYLYESQAPTLLGWGFTPHVPGGGTREILDSYSAYIFDGYAYRIFTGLRPDNLRLNSQSGTDFLMLEIDGVGMKEVFDTGDAAWTSAIFPDPYAEPEGRLYTHQMAESQVVLDTVNMGDKLQSISVAVRNINDHRHMGGTYISRNSFNGRTITLGATPYSDDDKYYLMFRDQTPGQVTIRWQLDVDNYVDFTSNEIAYLDQQERSTQLELDVTETQQWTMHEVEATDPDITTDFLYTPPGP